MSGRESSEMCSDQFRTFQRELYMGISDVHDQSVNEVWGKRLAKLERSRVTEVATSKG